MPLTWIALVILLTPLVLLPGGTLRLTCTVPREAANRRLSYGVIDYSASERVLDGARAAMTWQVWIPHVPAGSGLAYCAVTNNLWKVTRVTQRFVMGEE